MPARLEGESPELKKFVSMIKWQGLWYFPGKPWSIWKVVQLVKLALVWVCVVLAFISISMYTVAEALKKPYLSFLGLCLVTAIFDTIFLLKRAELEEFRRGMEKVIRRRPEGAEVFSRETARLWTLMGYFLAANWTYIFLYSCVPILVDVGLAIYTLGAAKPLVVPMILDGFQPAEPSRDFWFYSLNIFHGFLTANAAIIYTGTIASSYTIVLYIQIELKRIHSEVVDWSAVSGLHRGRLLSDIADKHVNILRLVELAKTIIGPCSALQNFVASINIALLAHFSKKALVNGEYITATVNIYTILFQVSYTYLSCLTGESLRTQGLRLTEALYEAGWERDSPRVRKVLQLIMVASQRDIVIDFKRKLPLKLETFTETLGSLLLSLVVACHLDSELSDAVRPIHGTHRWAEKGCWIIFLELSDALMNTSYSIFMLAESLQ